MYRVIIDAAINVGTKCNRRDYTRFEASKVPLEGALEPSKLETLCKSIKPHVVFGLEVRLWKSCGWNGIVTELGCVHGEEAWRKPVRHDAQ